MRYITVNGVILDNNKYPISKGANSYKVRKSVQNTGGGTPGGGTGDVPVPTLLSAGSGDVKIVVKFATNPTAASSSILKTKYGKSFIYDFCIDDNPRHFIDFVNYIQGGLNTIDGVTYPGKTVTDGCGNPIKWKATVACNVKNSFNDNYLMDPVNGYNSIYTTDLPGIVEKGCYPSVHGYYHFDDPNAASPDGYADNGFSRSTNVSECAKYLWQNSNGFLPRIMVIPQDSAGYNVPLKAQGYFAQSSQGVYDNEKRFPDTPEIFNHSNIIISDVQTWYNTPGAFSAFGRRYIYDWTDSVNQTGPALADVDYTLSVATQDNPQMLRCFTHGVDGVNWTGAKAFFDAIETKAGDNLWFATLHEVMEYLETARLVQKTETLSGDTLTIKLNYNNIPKENLLRDLSLKVSADATIQSVTVSNAQDSSYNVSTGLINVFNKRHAGVTAYPYSQLMANGGTLATGIIPIEAKDIYLDNSEQVWHDALVDGDLVTNYAPAGSKAALIYPNYDLVIHLERFRTTVSKVDISFGGGSGGTTATQVILVKTDGTEVNIGTWTQNGFQQTDSFWFDNTGHTETPYKVAKLILRATTNLSYGAEIRVYGSYQPILSNTYSKPYTPLGYKAGVNLHPWNLSTNEPHSVDTAKMNAFKSLDLYNGSIRLYDDAYAVQDIDGKWRIGTEVRGFTTDAAFTQLKTDMPNLFKWRDHQNQSLITQATWDVSDASRKAIITVNSYTDNGSWGSMQATVSSITGDLSGINFFHIYSGGIKIDVADQTGGSMIAGQTIYFNVGGNKGYTAGQSLEFRKSQKSHINMTWPADNNLNKSDITIYHQEGYAAFVYASRLGNNPNVPDYPCVDNSNGENPMTKGSDLVEGFEGGNEWNAYWTSATGFLNGADYATAWSMIYDGHMGTYSSRGVKQADSTLPVLSTGTASDKLDLWYGAIEWAKKYRGYNPDGTINFPADVINAHCYSSTGGQYASSGGLPPEQGMKRQLSDLAWLNENYLPRLQLFISEWGWDANQSSPLAAKTFGVYTDPRQIAGMWHVRGMLLFSKLKVDRSQAYRLYQDSNSDDTNSTQFATMALLRENAPGDISRTLVGDYFKQYMEFRNYTFDSEISTGLTGVYCYKFTYSGKSILALWSEENTTITNGSPSFTERTGNFSVPVTANSPIIIRAFVDNGTGVMTSQTVTPNSSTYSVAYGSKPKIIQL